VTDWFDNDELFRKELEAGHKWAALVTTRLNDAGIPAQLTPLAWRESIDDRHDFANETDITVQTPNGILQLESKSRALHFTEDPASYPYPTAFVDTVSGWDKKTVKPFAVILTSQKTQQMLVVPSQSKTLWWLTTSAYDRVRHIQDVWYEVPCYSLLPFQALVDAINNRL
jgi:hypothetical protein